MGLFTSINIASTGLAAERLKSDVISNNIANASTTRTQEGGPFKRSSVIFEPVASKNPTWRSPYLPENLDNGAGQGGGININRYLFRKVFICHMIYADIDQIIHIVIHIFSVRIAPFAVFFVEKTVPFLADALILQRHTAALANKLPGRAQKRVDGHIKELGKKLQGLGVGHSFAVFPTAHRLPGDKHLFRQLLLRPTLLFSQMNDLIRKCHSFFSFG